MPCRSPSKFLSLKYLIFIAENDFCNKDKGIDYEPTEILDLIHKKQAKTSEVLQAKLSRANEAQIIELLVKAEQKHCSLCGHILHFSEFHKDLSKKTFGLKSHCKGCRSIPF